MDGASWTVCQRGASRLGRGGAGSIAVLSLSAAAGAVRGPLPPDSPTRYFLARSVDDVPEEELVSFIRECAPHAD